MRIVIPTAARHEEYAVECSLMRNEVDAVREFDVARSFERLTRFAHSPFISIRAA